MSAIWGYINLNSEGKDLTKKIAEVSSVMKEPYKQCAIDRFEEKKFDNGFFACGIQYFNKRSRDEKLPFYDIDDEIVFTADIVLNDRKTLVDELNEAGFTEVSLETPDGELAFKAWKKWDCDFTEHILGLFAIAIYIKKDNAFYLYTDHLGCRCVDYSICGDELFFSTLSSPIVNAMPREYRGFDEKFISGCESSMTAYMYIFPDRTPFCNVFHTVRGNYIKAVPDGSKWKYCSKTYYEPGADHKLSRKWPENPRDPEYRNAFREVFFDCVQDAIDTDGEVAATISSGLDSSSVATVAARLLQGDNRKLYGFTSVPLKDFEYDNPGFDLPDESEGVKHIVAGYPNIEQEFCDCEGMSSFTEMDELVRVCEMPGKAFVNQVWIKHIVKSAAGKGCKVLLNGQYGNFTISRGEMKRYFFQKLLSGNVSTAKKQLAIFGAKYGVPRKVLLDGVLKAMREEATFRLGINKEMKEIFENLLLRPELFKKYRTEKVLIKRYRYYGFTEVESVKKMYRNLGDINILQTQGLYDTKFSLFYGVQFRDPTRDKRLMELCASFPPEQYVYNGLERRLVREYLDDFLPEYERLQVKYKGRQSCDMVTRLKTYGDEHKETVLDSMVYDFLDKNKVADLMKEDIQRKNALDIVRVIALSRFFTFFKSSVTKK